MISEGVEYVGYSGSGSFSQSGGINGIDNGFYIGYNAGTAGTYNLSGSGVLLGYANEDEYVGYSGTGTFNQSGGTNTAYLLTLGSASGSGQIGTYNLSGNSLLATTSERVGAYSSSGIFVQSGGTNVVATLLSITQSSSYLLAGGLLQINGGLQNQGVFAGSSTPGTLGGSGIVDLTQGTWQTLGQISVSMGTNSLVIVPAGFNTATAFAHYTRWV